MALSATSLILVPIVFLKEVKARYKASKGLRPALRDVFKATCGWSPKEANLRREYFDMLAKEKQEEEEDKEQEEEKKEVEEEEKEEEEDTTSL